MPDHITESGFAAARALISQGFGDFLPEILLSVLVCVLLLHDVFVRGARPGRTAALAAVGLVGCGALLFLRWPETSYEIFGWQDGSTHRGLMRVDRFGWFFKFFILAGTLVTVPMCLAYRQFDRRRMGEFYALLVGATLGMFLMVGASNLLMIYLGIEFASMASYLATAFLKRDVKGSEAGLKYVIYGSVASGVMIYGLSLIYGMTGSLHLGDIAEKLAVTSVSGPGLAVAAVLTFAGFAYKMAAFPMHFWCPDVYEGAPTPFTAYLSVTSKAAGFALFIRFLMAFGPGFHWSFEGVDGFIGKLNIGWAELVAAAAALSMTIGNLAALWQGNVKRMLAYSSVAQAGYLLMGVAVLDPGAEAGTSQYSALLFYFVVYFFMNLGAFYVVTLVSTRTGREDMPAYAGLGRRSPFLGFCLALCLISLLGVPPTGGFTGKLQLFMQVIKHDGGKMIWLAVVAGINTAISAYYYFKLLKAVYLDDSPETSPVRFSTASMALLALLSIPTLVLGLAFNSVSVFTQGFSL